MNSILIVCSGNLCRSPFAEGLLRRMLTDRFGASAPAVSSVGTIARDGAPATPEAIVVASEHGIDASSDVASLVFDARGATMGIDAPNVIRL